MQQLGSLVARMAPRRLGQPSSVFLRMMSAEASRSPLTVFNEEQEMLRDSVRRFAEERIRPIVREMDDAEKMPADLVKDLFEQGFMGIEVDPEYGGSGMSFTECMIIVEELARVDPAVSALVDIHNTLTNRCFVDYGTHEQKVKYLTPLATESVGSFAISEPGAGSDAFSLRTRAELTSDGKHYKINGSKCWISNSKESDYFVLFANVDPSKGYKGITAFIVEKTMPGFEIAKKEDKLGIKASSTCVLHFTDLMVPAENVLGEVGKGYKIAIDVLNEGRIGIAAQMLGCARGAFHEGMMYAHERKQFGQPIANFQGMRFQYADAATEIEAAHLMVYNAAALKDGGHPFIKEAAMAKLYASEMALRVTSGALQWMGGVGFTREYPLEKYYRDAMIGVIYEGTSNMQRETIGKLLQKEYGDK